MKKTLFLSAILGAALCQTTWADTETVTLGSTQYANTSVMTTGTLASNPGGDYLLLATGNNTYTTVANNTWFTDENMQTILIAPATRADGTTTNGGRLQLQNHTIYADIIAGGSNSDDLYMTGSGSVLKGTLTAAPTGRLQIWNQNGTNHIEGAINAADKEFRVVGNNGNAKLRLSGGATIGTLSSGDQYYSHVVFSNTKSDGVTAAASTTYTVGELYGTGTGINYTVESNVNLTIGSINTTSNLSNAGSLSITNGGTLRKKIANTGTLSLGGTFTLSGIAAASSELYCGDTVEGATLNGNGYLISGTRTYQITTGNGTVTSTATFADADMSGGTCDAAGLVTLSKEGGTASGIYYVNNGVLDYTTTSAAASAATTGIKVTKANTTITIAGDATLAASKLDAQATTKLSGSGLYIAGSATTLGSNVSLADSWTGTVQLTGALNGNVNFYQTAAKAASTLEMKGVTGWFYNWYDVRGSVNANIKLTDVNDNTLAWVNGAFGGHSDKPVETFTGTWSGTGSFRTDINNDREMNYTYSGNIENWTGKFIYGGKGTSSSSKLTFTGDADDVNITIEKAQGSAGTFEVIADTNAAFTKKITAAKMTVNSGKSVTLGTQAHEIGELIIEAGATVTTTHVDSGDGFIKNGNVTVKAGATLDLSGTKNDGLGYNANAATAAVTLTGAEGNKAVMKLSYEGEGSTTLRTKLYLNGYAEVKSTANQKINTFYGSITATGTNNVISSGLNLRKHITVDVTNSTDTLTLGAIGYHTDGTADNSVTLTKTGNGVLTIEGNIDVHADGNNVATIAGDGANTIIASPTISNIKLNNVTLSEGKHTIENTVYLHNSAATLTDFISVDGNLTLSGTTAVSMTNAGSDKGIWMGKGKTITIQDTASLSVAGDISVKAADSNGATLTATGDTNQIGTNQAFHDSVDIDNADITVTGNTLREYKISGGSVTVDSNKTTNINSALSDGTDLTVNSGSTANFTKTDSNVKAISGEGAVTVGENADLTVNAASTIKQLGGLGTVKALDDLTVTGGEDVALGGLEIAGGTTVTLGTAEAHNHTLALNKLTVKGAGSTINANLNLSGATVTLNGNSVTLGCDLKFSGTTITLSDADIAIISNEEGAGLVIFNDVESLTLGTTTYTTDYIGLVEDSGLILTLAQGATSALPDKVFVNFSATDKTVSLTVVPEPATATLSLLALAALAARRKRK